MLFIKVMMEEIRIVVRHLTGTTGSACTTGGPKLPGISTPLVYINSALQVLASITRSRATRTSVPVVTVDLPQSNIPQVGCRLASVVADSVSISPRLVTHDALAVGLVPGVLGAPGSNIQNVLGGTTRARRAVSTRTVATTGRATSGSIEILWSWRKGTSHGDGQESSDEGNEKEVHFRGSV